MDDSENIRGRTLTLIQSYLSLYTQGRWDAWGALWAEDGVLEFPFAADPHRRAYRGRQAIVEYMQEVAGRIAVEERVRSIIRPQLDPRHLVLEGTIRGHAVTTGRPYNQSYAIFVEMSDDGQIGLWREYYNPLISQAAFDPVQGA